MSKKKTGQPSWFKVWGHDYPAFKSIPSDELGDALKIALDYFLGIIPDGVDDTRQGVTTAFMIFADHIDETMNDLEESRKNGKIGADARWHKIREESSEHEQDK